MSVNKPSAFLDTDIWMASMDERDETKQNLAKRLISKNEVIVTTQIINEISVNLIKKMGYTEYRVREFLKEIYDKHKIIDIGYDIFEKGSELRERYDLGYWEGLIAASAIAGDAKMIYSDKLPDGLVIEGKIGVINPFKF